jgi:hypothetical protein
MPVTTDIVRTWRGPGAVMHDHLARGRNEPRVLAFLMGACFVMFVARWPALARQAHLEDQDLNLLMGGALMGLIFVAPLLFYGLAFAVHLVNRVSGGQGSAYEARLALFWSLLASSPLILLHGLVAGFVGPGPGLTLVGALWLAAFLWFVLASMRRVRRAEAAA